MNSVTSNAEEMNIPPFFICPITLQIMRDPVTLTTGITYDRHSIDQWLSAMSPPVCPVTKQLLPDTLLTPNTTLRRLIQSWCAANSLDRIPTPRAPLDKPDIARLLDNLRLPQAHPASLRKLLDAISQSTHNRRSAEDAGAAHVLVDLVKKSTINAEEYLAVLHELRLSEDGFRDLVARNADLVDTLTAVLRDSPSCRCRGYAISLVQSLFEAVSPVRLVTVRRGFFVEVVRVLEDRMSSTATRAALQVLRELMPWGRNRVRAVESGAVEAIIELLLEGPGSRRVTEMMMDALEMMCGCAEGRQAVVGHAAGIAVVAEAVLGVSSVASERAVKVLCMVAKHSGRADVVREMAGLRVVEKLCMAMQVQSCGGRSKKRVLEVLRLHSNVWGRSPCVDQRLIATWL